MALDCTKYDTLVQQAKLRLLRMHYESGVGHIGGNLSALDAMLYLQTLEPLVERTPGLRRVACGQYAFRVDLPQASGV